MVKALCQDCNGDDKGAFAGDLTDYIDPVLGVRVATGSSVVDACNHHVQYSDDTNQHNTFFVTNNDGKTIGTLMASSLPGPQIFISNENNI